MAFTDTESIVSLADVKLHLRVDHAFEDGNIAIYRDAAISDVSAYLRRDLLQRARVDYFTWADIQENPDVIYPRRPDITDLVVEVFLDTAYSTIAASEYRLEDAENNPHVVFYNRPTYNNDGSNVLRLSYNSGVASLEPAIKSAILLQIGSLYDNREDVVVNANAVKLPLSAEYLCSPYRFLRQ